MTTKILTEENITKHEIDCLAAEAARAGDLLQHAICQLANGEKDYSDAAWLEANTCLDESDRRRLAAMDVDSALAECVRVIRDGAGNQ